MKSGGEITGYASGSTYSKHPIKEYVSLPLPLLCRYPTTIIFAVNGVLFSLDIDFFNINVSILLNCYLGDV
jgi:hypothetical protein